MPYRVPGRVLRPLIDELRALIAGVKASGGNAESDHLIDHVALDPSVTALGSGAVVSIQGDNFVILATTSPPFPAKPSPNAYGVYEGVAGTVRTTGVVPDVRVDPGLLNVAAGVPLYVGPNAGSLTTSPSLAGQQPFAEVVDASGYALTGRVKAYVRPIIP